MVPQHFLFRHPGERRPAPIFEVAIFFIGHGQLDRGDFETPRYGFLNFSIFRRSRRSLARCGASGPRASRAKWSRFLTTVLEASSFHSFPDQLRVNLPSSHPQYRRFVILWCSYSELIDQVQGLDKCIQPGPGGSTSRLAGTGVIGWNKTWSLSWRTDRRCLPLGTWFDSFAGRSPWASALTATPYTEGWPSYYHLASTTWQPNSDTRRSPRA